MTDVKTRLEPELSTAPKGVWRNVYQSTNGWKRPKDPSRLIDAQTCYGNGTFQTVEIAEQKAVEMMARRRAKGEWETVTYLGAEFFPEGGQ